MEKFLIEEKMTAELGADIVSESLKNVWRGFTFTVSELECRQTLEDAVAIKIGNAPLPERGADKEYAILVTKDGASVVGENKNALMRGFFDLVQKVEYEQDGTLYIKAGAWQSSYLFGIRMIHVCAFVQTRLWDLKRLIRLSAAVGYTHAVIEFWGMFPYECEKGLSWDEAYTKDEIRELVREMRELGIEPIPMINHLGHAASGRVTGGKHSALDRSPRLYRYFTPDGWSWDVSSPYVRRLLKEMRKEQYELFGACEYFHLGLDEAYMYATSPTHKAALPEYLSYITSEIIKEGRRPMIWMDMFLPPESGTPHICSCENDADMYAALGSIHKDTVLVDWEYGFKEAPFPTTKYITERTEGLDVMCAPWTDRANFKSAIKTVDELKAFGFMMTSWHTMAKNMATVIESAHAFGGAKAPWSDVSGSVEGKREECATLLRKLAFEGVSTYRDAGWCDDEITLSIGEIG